MENGLKIIIINKMINGDITDIMCLIKRIHEGGANVWVCEY